MSPLQFSGQIRYWRPESAAGLAVVDVPAEMVESLGGLRQVRVRGTINAVEFLSNVMPAGGGRLALSVSKTMMSSAGVAIGQSAAFVISQTGRD